MICHGLDRDEWTLSMMGGVGFWVLGFGSGVAYW